MKKLLSVLIALAFMLSAASLAETTGLKLEEPEVFTPEWFMEDNPEAIEGEPHLEFEIDIYETQEETSRGLTNMMRFDIYVRETAGLPFTLTRVDQFGFWWDDGRYEYDSFDGGVIWYDYGEDPHWELSGRNPVQFCLGFGYIFYGVDAEGNELSFRTWVDQSSFTAE